jgi:anaerobic dimethyl sulfoxide reductase subunit A
VRHCCSGFDSSQMPEGFKDKESYSDYILGRRDGIPKTPDWASRITQVPAVTIERIARDYASTKPAMLYQGYGMQRRAYGEQPVLAGCALAAITGNVGIAGGWASGMALQADDGGPFWNVFPTGVNPVKTTIPVFLWTEAILRGKEMGPDDGVRGTDSLGHDLKLIWAVASNILINQHANVNRNAEILGNEALVEFIVVQDQFMTPSARFADLVLPVCTQFETWGLEDGWKYGDEVILMPKVVEPPGEAKTDYEICTLVARKLGLEEAFTKGKTEKEWIAWAIEQYRNTRFPGIPGLETLEESNAGVYSMPVTEPKIAFTNFRKDPEKYPLHTPSGKIELFSTLLYVMNKPDEIPAVPKYIQEWESPFGPEAVKYPLQAIGHHSMSRVHSTHDNNEWTMEAFPQRLFINPLDAEKRGLREGDKVMVYNDRGKVLVSCRLTRKIMPGVVDLPQGAWWMPGKDGIDRGGNINVLTSERWTPLAFGNAQHTVMVEVKKYKS